METHIVPVVRQWKHIVNAQSACQVTTPTDNGMLPLVILPNGGSATFCTNSSQVHVETDGLFEIVPFDNAQLPADQAYSPDSTNAQSGTAVAGALRQGITIEAVGPMEGFTMGHNAVFSAVSHSGSIPLSPADSTAVTETKLILRDNNVPATPLIAVPQGVTLHWAGDEEPTWEAGKDYVIQLLQTGPTHIEARLFNAPQGAKLPDSYVSWVVKDGVNVIDKVRIGSATDLGYFLKFRYSGRSLVLNTAELFKGETFTGITSIANFFANVSEYTADFPDAEFNDVTDAAGAFYNGALSVRRGEINLPKATFDNATDISGLFQYAGRVYLPKATFSKVKSALKWVQFSSFYTRRDLDVDIPMATFESMVNLVNFLLTEYNSGGTSGGSLNWPRVNLRKASQVNINSFNLRMRPENVMCVVYGPRLNTDGEIDVENGEHKTDDGMSPTGWGINDFRDVDAQGNFVKVDGNYNYTKKPTGEFKLFIKTAAPDETLMKALDDLRLRGWTFTTTYVS